ncbi:MAG: hypothetical protein CL947_01850 [Epsilonproteobacteria bacterium]|nr:hypothetical protein [Campylobacterota bacterium]|tara:strand:- start:5298 stop:5783 length:486 start_codon:yes stop_codon:yes gene_type:complete
MNAVINEVFRILNFLVVVGVFAYIVRRFGILQIVMMMRQEKAEKKVMKDQLKFLSDQCASLDDDMQEQEESYRIMKDKFQIWQHQVKEHNQKIETVLKDRHIESEQKQVRVVQSLQKRRLVKQHVPIMLDEVRQELYDTFEKNDQEKTAYVKKLFTILDEK